MHSIRLAAEGGSSGLTMPSKHLRSRRTVNIHQSLGSLMAKQGLKAACSITGGSFAGRPFMDKPFRCHCADAEALPNLFTPAVVSVVQSFSGISLPSC